MNIKFYFLIVLTFCIKPVIAQKENNVWTFGTGVGIDFNPSVPTIISTAITTYEGGASICDLAGKLLFYSNGLNVWDNTNTVMPNGSGILGAPDLSSTMGVAITAIPDNPNLYFLFTLDSYGHKAAQLKYSLIDMTLNGGKGDVVAATKNIVLGDTMGEKMIVAASCEAVWIITHHRDSSIFYAYKITNTTIPSPIKTMTLGNNYKNKYSSGEIKISPDYRHIAMGGTSASSVPLPKENNLIFDFDNNTGIVSGYYPIDSTNIAYSLDFSADGTKLYVANIYSKISQYDISLLPNVAAVLASKYILLNSGYLSLRRGPNGKLYSIRYGYPGQINSINKPNIGGVGCDEELDIPALRNTSKAFLNFGNNTFRTVKKDTFQTVKDTIICGPNFIYNGKNFHTDYLWNDGDTSRNRSFTTSGQFWLSFRQKCNFFIDTLKLNFYIKDATTSLLDTVICFEKKYIVKAKESFENYLWDDGSSERTNVFTTTGRKWVMSNLKDCKINIDSFKITLTDFELNIPDTVICKNEIILLDASVNGATKYNWQDNSLKNTFQVSEPGKYWVEVSKGFCTRRASVNVEQKPFNISLGEDRRICKGSSTTLEADLNDVFYFWQDGSTNKNFTVTEDGVYAVKVTQKGCSTEDSIRVDFVKCTDCIKIPNAFTPNGDGNNDFFKTLLACPIQSFSLIIVNRYGQQIFKTDKPTELWDGNFNNQEQQLGTYYYLLKVKFEHPNALEEMYKGDISLIR